MLKFGQIVDIDALENFHIKSGPDDNDEKIRYALTPATACSIWERADSFPHIRAEVLKHEMELQKLRDAQSQKKLELLKATEENTR